jgi:hypothetical protein
MLGNHQAVARNKKATGNCCFPFLHLLISSETRRNQEAQQTIITWVRVQAPRRRGPGGGEGVEREVDDDGAVGVPAAALAAARPGLPLLRHVGHLPTVQEEDLVAHRVHRYDGFSDPVAQPTGAMERPAVAGWGFAAA